MLKNNFWIYGGQLLINEKAQLPVISTSCNNSYLMFSSRDKKGRSYGKCAKLTSLFPLQLDLPKTIIKHGQIGSFDVAGVMPMQVVDKYLFYIGWTLRKDVPYFNYLSVSEFDEKLVRKIGPILGPDIYESGYSGTFHVHKFPSKYIGYYLSVTNWSKDELGIVNPCYDIKIAESYDLLNWNRLGKYAVSRKGDEAGISAFTVIEFENKFHAWFSVRKGQNFRNNPLGGYYIGHAVSDDGLTWVRDEKFTILPGDFKGCENMAAYPTTYIAGKYLVIVFNGNGFGDDGIHWCYMELSDLLKE